MSPRPYTNCRNRTMELTEPLAYAERLENSIAGAQGLIVSKAVFTFVPCLAVIVTVVLLLTAFVCTVK